MGVSKAATVDGYLLELSWDRGRGSKIPDFMTQLKTFGGNADTEYYYLTVKGDPRVLKKLYDPIRAKSASLVGTNPVGMPITSASGLAIFLWPYSSFEKVGDEEALTAFSQAVSATTIGRMPPDPQVIATKQARKEVMRARRHRPAQAAGVVMLVAILAYLLYVFYPNLLSLLG